MTQIRARWVLAVALISSALATLPLLPALAGQINYTYDDLGRLTKTQYGGASAPKVEYSYDPAGNRTLQTAAVGTSPAVVGPATIDSITGSATSDSLSFTSAVGANLLVVVFAGEDRAVTALTYDGQTLTKAADRAESVQKSEIWYMTSPPSGAHTLAISAADQGASSANASQFAVFNVTGVTAAAPRITASAGNSSTGQTAVSTTNVAILANELVISGLSVGDATTSQQPNSGTEHVDADSPSTSVSLGVHYEEEGSAVSKSYGYTFSGAARPTMTLAVWPRGGGGSSSTVYSIGSASATEAGTMTFTVTRTGTAIAQETIQYAAASGTATSGVDFAATSGTLTFQTSDTSQTFTVVSNPDTAYEGNETLTATLSNPSAGTIGTNNGIGTINDDDTPSSFSVAASSATEGSQITFTVTKTGSTALSHSVNYATNTSGTATPADDFTATSGTLTFTSGQTTQTFTVDTVQDTGVEGNETIGVVLSAPTAGATLGTSTANGTINDDDTPSNTVYSIGNASATEGVTMTFTVSRTGTAGGVETIQYGTSSGMATSGTDFTAASGTLTFQTSDTSKTFTVSTTQDTIYEGNETLTATLSSPSNGSIGTGIGAGTISEDDTSPSFSVAASSATEGGTVTFTVTKTGSTSLAHAVDYATSSDSATQGTDFTGVTGTLNFASGDTTKTFTVTTTQDVTQESNETFVVTLSGATAGSTIGTATANGTINDDDGPSTTSYSIANQSATEGASITFTVTRTGTPATVETIQYATSSGTATSGTDFTAVSNTLTFQTSDTSKTFTVSTTQDTVYEGNETLTATLSNASAGSIGTASATGTINENDTAPSFSVAASSATEGGPVTFTVTKTGSTALAHDVNYATSSGTATQGTDFTSASGTLSFASGDTTKTFTVNTTQDSTSESNETFTVTLSGATAGATIGTATANGTINDDDATSNTAYTFSNASATEGSSITFTVTRTGTPVGVETIDYATSSGTATSGTDFTAASGTLTFQISDTSKTFAVSTTQDTTYEGNETLTATLANLVGGASITNATRTGTINENDTAPSFAINNSSATEGSSITFTVTKTGTTALSHDINYASSSGTATSGTDFTATSGALTFTSGQTTRTFTVATTNDSAAESNETLNITLSSATNGATISDSSGVGTINDNDSPIVLTNADGTLTAAAGSTYAKSGPNCSFDPMFSLTTCTYQVSLTSNSGVVFNAVSFNGGDYATVSISTGYSRIGTQMQVQVQPAYFGVGP